MQIEVDVTSQNIYSSSQAYHEILILTDDSSTWTTNIVNVRFEKIEVPLFSQTSSISITFGEVSELSADLGNNSFKARSCDGKEIDWI